MKYHIILFFLIISTVTAQWETIGLPNNEQIDRIVSDENILYAGTVLARVYRSSDHGESWTQIGGDIDEIAYATDVLLKKDSYLFFSHNVGSGNYNFRCFFNGEEWETWNPLPYQTSSFMQMKSNSNFLFTIIAGGIAYSDDYGESWTLMAQPPLEGYLNIPFVDDSYVYVNHGCNLYRTNSMGESWEDVTGVLDDIGPPEPYSCTTVQAVTMVQDRLVISVYWYGGVGRLFHSDNYGDTWEWIDTFPSQSGSGMGDNNVNALAGVSDYLFAGTATSQDGLFYTNDFENWTEYSGGLDTYSLSFESIISTNEFLFKTGGTVSVYRSPIPEEINMETTWYVSPDGSDATGNGTENDPFETIQHAINVSADGDFVLALPGIYYEQINFDGKDITVGSQYHTTGDTSYIEETVIDGSDETCPVTFWQGETRDAILTGFTIQNGLGCVYGQGGGIYIEYSSPTLNHLIIQNNHATTSGGGVLVNIGSNPLLKNLTIRSNSFDMNGGGISISGASAEIENCNIHNNHSMQNYSAGGGISFSNSTGSISNSTISTNIVDDKGGGIYCNNANLTLNHTVIVKNSANHGGGVYGGTNSTVNIQFVTISDNNAEDGGGIYLKDNSTSLVDHTILWNDSPQEIFLSPNDAAAQVSVGYSDVQGGEEGIVTNDNGYVYWFDGNIESDPLFCEPENGNYFVAANSPCQILSSDIGALGVGCDALWEFALYGPELSDASGNGIWEPGESLSVSVTMCNEGTMDHGYYPGVTLSEIYPSPDITINNPEFWWYGMFAGQCESAGFTLTASGSIASGTQVDLLAEATVLNCSDLPEFCINDASLEFLIQIGAPFGETVLEVQYSESWNLIGLPVIVEDSGYESFFEGAVSGTLYSFDNGYTLETELVPGTGYWVRLDSDELVNFTGGPIQEIIIQLNEGWNLISGISIPVPVENIVDSEGIIISGTIYQYSEGYTPSEFIEPGRAYWVRSSGEGEVIVQISD